MASPTTEPATTHPTFVPQGRHLGKPALAIARPFTLIGSRQRAHLHLVSDSISKCHAAVINTGQGVYVRDLASRTHVFINGRQANEGELRDSDLLKVGNFTFKFVDATTPLLKNAKTPPAAALEVEGATEPLALHGRSTVIGRRPTCDVSLLEPSVSTIHALIYEAGGKYFIRDLGSRTGTIINGTAIHHQQLSAGDRLKIGETEFRFVVGETQDDWQELEDLVGTRRLGADAGEVEITPAQQAEIKAEAESFAQPQAPARSFRAVTDRAKAEPAASPTLPGARPVAPIDRVPLVPLAPPIPVAIPIEPVPIERELPFEEHAALDVVATEDLAPMELAPEEFAAVDHPSEEDLAPVELAPLEFAPEDHSAVDEHLVDAHASEHRVPIDAAPDAIESELDTIPIELEPLEFAPAAELAPEAELKAVEEPALAAPELDEIDLDTEPQLDGAEETAVLQPPIASEPAAPPTLSPQIFDDADELELDLPPMPVGAPFEQVEQQLAPSPALDDLDFDFELVPQSDSRDHSPIPPALWTPSAAMSSADYEAAKPTPPAEVSLPSDESASVDTTASIDEVPPVSADTGAADPMFDLGFSPRLGQPASHEESAIGAFEERAEPPAAGHPDPAADSEEGFFSAEELSAEIGLSPDLIGFRGTAYGDHGADNHADASNGDGLPATDFSLDHVEPHEHAENETGTQSAGALNTPRDPDFGLDFLDETQTKTSHAEHANSAETSAAGQTGVEEPFDMDLTVEEAASAQLPREAHDEQDLHAFPSIEPHDVAGSQNADGEDHDNLLDFDLSWPEDLASGATGAAAAATSTPDLLDELDELPHLGQSTGSPHADAIASAPVAGAKIPTSSVKPPAKTAVSPESLGALELPEVDLKAPGAEDEPFDMDLLEPEDEDPDLLDIDLPELSEHDLAEAVADSEIAEPEAPTQETAANEIPSFDIEAHEPPEVLDHDLPLLLERPTEAHDEMLPAHDHAVADVHAEPVAEHHESVISTPAPLESKAELSPGAPVEVSPGAQLEMPTAFADDAALSFAGPESIDSAATLSEPPIAPGEVTSTTEPASALPDDFFDELTEAPTVPDADLDPGATPTSAHDVDAAHFEVAATVAELTASEPDIVHGHDIVAADEIPAPAGLPVLTPRPPAPGPFDLGELVVGDAEAAIESEIEFDLSEEHAQPRNVGPEAADEVSPHADPDLLDDAFAKSEGLSAETSQSTELDLPEISGESAAAFSQVAVPPAAPLTDYLPAGAHAVADLHADEDSFADNGHPGTAASSEFTPSNDLADDEFELGAEDEPALSDDEMVLEPLSDDEPWADESHISPTLAESTVAETLTGDLTAAGAAAEDLSNASLNYSQSIVDHGGSSPDEPSSLVDDAEFEVDPSHAEGLASDDFVPQHQAWFNAEPTAPSDVHSTPAPAPSIEVETAVPSPSLEVDAPAPLEPLSFEIEASGPPEVPSNETFSLPSFDEPTGTIAPPMLAGATLSDVNNSAPELPAGHALAEHPAVEAPGATPSVSVTRGLQPATVAPSQPQDPSLKQFDPFFGMQRDFGSFLGGMPLRLPSAPPAPRRPVLPFGQVPVTFDKIPNALPEAEPLIGAVEHRTADSHQAAPPLDTAFPLPPQETQDERTTPGASEFIGLAEAFGDDVAEEMPEPSPAPIGQPVPVPPSYTPPVSAAMHEPPPSADAWRDLTDDLDELLPADQVDELSEEALAELRGEPLPLHEELHPAGEPEPMHLDQAIADSESAIPELTADLLQSDSNTTFRADADSEIKFELEPLSTDEASHPHLAPADVFAAEPHAKTVAPESELEFDLEPLSDDAALSELTAADAGTAEPHANLGMPGSEVEFDLESLSQESSLPEPTFADAAAVEPQVEPGWEIEFDLESLPEEAALPELTAAETLAGDSHANIVEPEPEMEFELEPLPDEPALSSDPADLLDELDLNFDEPAAADPTQAPLGILEPSQKSPASQPLEPSPFENETLHDAPLSAEPRAATPARLDDDIRHELPVAEEVNYEALAPLEEEISSEAPLAAGPQHELPLSLGDEIIHDAPPVHEALHELPPALEDVHLDDSLLAHDPAHDIGAALGNESIHNAGAAHEPHTVDLTAASNLPEAPATDDLHWATVSADVETTPLDSGNADLLDLDSLDFDAPAPAATAPPAPPFEKTPFDTEPVETAATLPAVPETAEYDLLQEIETPAPADEPLNELHLEPLELSATDLHDVPQSESVSPFATEPLPQEPPPAELTPADVLTAQPQANVIAPKSELEIDLAELHSPEPAAWNLPELEVEPLVAADPPPEPLPLDPTEAAAISGMPSEPEPLTAEAVELTPMAPPPVIPMPLAAAAPPPAAPKRVVGAPPPPARARRVRSPGSDNGMESLAGGLTGAAAGMGAAVFGGAAMPTNAFAPMAGAADPRLGTPMIPDIRKKPAAGSQPVRPTGAKPSVKPPAGKPVAKGPASASGGKVIKGTVPKKLAPGVKPVVRPGAGAPVAKSAAPSGAGPVRVPAKPGAKPPAKPSTAKSTTPVSEIKPAGVRPPGAPVRPGTPAAKGVVRPPASRVRPAGAAPVRPIPALEPEMIDTVEPVVVPLAPPPFGEPPTPFIAAGSAGMPSKDYRRTLRVILLIVVVAAAAVIGTWIFLHFHSQYAVEGRIRFNRLAEMSPNQREEFQQLRRRELFHVDTRNRARDAALAMNVQAGFLGDQPDDLTSYEQFVRAAAWTPRGDTLVLQRTTEDPASEKFRLQAMLKAIYERSAAMLDEVAKARSERDEVQKAFAETNEKWRALEERVKHENEMARQEPELHAKADELKQKADALATARDSAREKLAMLEREVEQLAVVAAAALPAATQPVTMQPTTAPSPLSDAARQVVEDTDPPMRSLVLEQREVNASLDAAKSSRDVQSVQAHATLDAAQRQFDAQISAARAAVGSDTKLGSYLAQLKTVHENIRKLNDELIQQQKDQRGKLDSMKADLLEMNADRLKKVWSEDLSLKEMQERHSVYEHRYNAAASARPPLPEAQKIKDEMGKLTKLIEARRDLLASKDSYDAITKRVQDFIEQGIKNMEDSRVRNDGRVQELLKLVAVPDVGALPENQRELAKQLDDATKSLATARGEYQSKVEHANASADSYVQGLTARAAALQAKVEARRNELMAQIPAVSQQRELQDAAAAQKRDQLELARGNESRAVAAAEEAALKYIAAQREVDEAANAGTLLKQHMVEKDLWKSQKEKSLARLEELKSIESSAVEPERPETDAVTVTPMDNPRDRYLVIVSTGCLAAGFVILGLTRSPAPLPALPVPPVRRPRRRRDLGPMPQHPSDEAVAGTLLEPMLHDHAGDTHPLPA